MARRPGKRRGKLQTIRRADQPHAADAEKERHQGASLWPGVGTVLATAGEGPPGPGLSLIGSTIPMTRTRRRLLVMVALLLSGGGLLLFAFARLTEEEPNYTLIEKGLYMGGDVPKPPPGTKAVLN